MNGQAIYGTLAANGDVGAVAGNATITPTVASTSLTAAAQTFTGSSGSTSAVSAGTPSGTNNAPALTMNSYTPVGTNGTSTTTASGTVAWPVAVPTFSGNAGTVPAETFTGSAANTSLVSAGTPAGTNGATATSGNCAATNIAAGTGSTTACKATAPNLTVPAEIFTGSALATHQHSVTATGTNGTVSFTPAGTVAWPVGSVPTFSGSSSSVGAQTFTGSAAVLTGSVAAPTFSGSALGTHSHTLTPAGTNGTSAVTGTITMNAVSPQYSGIKAIFCSKN